LNRVTLNINEFSKGRCKKKGRQYQARAENNDFAVFLREFSIIFISSIFLAMAISWGGSYILIQ